jgi:hypothetical protein
MVLCVPSIMQNRALLPAWVVALVTVQNAGLLTRLIAALMDAAVKMNLLHCVLGVGAQRFVHHLLSYLLGCMVCGICGTIQMTTSTNSTTTTCLSTLNWSSALSMDFDQQTHSDRLLHKFTFVMLLLPPSYCMTGQVTCRGCAWQLCESVRCSRPSAAGATAGWSLAGMRA